MNKIKILKTFATNVAISFFFAAIFVFTTYMLFDKKINYYTSLVNSFAIVIQKKNQLLMIYQVNH